MQVPRNALAAPATSSQILVRARRAPPTGRSSGGTPSAGPSSVCAKACPRSGSSRSGDLGEAIDPFLAGRELLDQLLDGGREGALVHFRDHDLLRLDLLQDLLVVGDHLR